MLPDHTIQKVQLFGHVEQSVSIDSHVSQKKQKNLRPKRRKRQSPSEEYNDEPMNHNDDSEHVDYLA